MVPDPPSAMGRIEETTERVVEAVKPRLRGWLHAGAFPVSVAAGIVLVVLSRDSATRVTTAIFAATAALLFGTSALYHRGRWSPRTHDVLKRLDHANIFLIIAGTYTPFAVLLLRESTARLLLSVVWVCAVLGVTFRVLWSGAPRWLSAPVYLLIGWVAALFLPEFLSSGSVAVLVLVAVGGAMYSVGGLVYALQRPDPSPRWFGFHEVFHALTLAGFACHYIAVSLVAYR